MKTKKTAAKKGRKAAAKRAAGKTSKAEVYKVPRRAEDLARAILKRVQRSPSYWLNLKNAVARMSASIDASRT